MGPCRRLGLALAASAVAACAPAGGGGACVANEDCAAGSVCLDQGCVALCSSDRDCPAGKVCGFSSTCVAGGVAPAIDAVVGNDPRRPSSVADGLVVQGRALGIATFVLEDDAGSATLQARAQTDERVELVLPVDVRAGDYVLAATNAAGATQTTVTLSLPDLDGTTLLNRLNSAAGTLVLARLPTGTGPGTVALGDHGHVGLAEVTSGGNADAWHSHTAIGGKTLAQIECEARLGQWSAGACLELATVGCDPCTWPDALASCGAARHLCTVVELSAGFHSFVAQLRYGTLSRSGGSAYMWSRGYDPVFSPDTAGNQMWYPWPNYGERTSCLPGTAPMFGFTAAGDTNATGAAGCYDKLSAIALALCCLNGAY